MLLELGHDRGFLASSTRGPFRNNLQVMPFRIPVGVISPGGLGILDQFPYWNAIFNLYRDENLDKAMAVVEEIGIGTYGDYALPGDFVFLEAATSADSEIIRLGEHLEVEVIREELPFSFDELASALLGAYKTVAQSFEQIAATVNTLATLLIKDGTIPTACFHDGYFTPKNAYGKICIPMPNGLGAIATTFTRGLVYQFGFEASDGQAEIWLLEAAQVLIEDKPVEMPPVWNSPKDLGLALNQEEDTPEAFDRLAEAKSQCRKIGHYLVARGGSDRLVQCLLEHRALSGSPGHGSIGDRTLKSIYGLDSEGLFDEAARS